MIITYSSMSKFNSCPRKYQFRYIKGLVPVDTDPALWFGSAIHDSLELLYKGCEDLIFPALESRYSNRAESPEENRDYLYATAMMQAYIAKYQEEPFHPVNPSDAFGEPFIEHKFMRELIPGVVLSGKIDGLVEVTEEWTDNAGNAVYPGYYLLEHKTSSNPDDFYWSSRWTDLQCALYIDSMQKLYGIQLSGCIYNVLAKPKLKQAIGETEEEYQARCAELIAKSKTGKTTAKQKIPESDEDFIARLTEWFNQPDRLQRRVLTFDRELIDDASASVENHAEELLKAMDKDRFCRRSSGCIEYGKPCEYMPICKPGHSKAAEEQYKSQKAHIEL